MAVFKRMLVAVENAFFPARCPYCDKVIHHDQYACEECKAKMPELPITNYIEGGYRCTSPFLYKERFSESVKAFKFRNRPQYAKALAFAVVTSLNITGDLRYDYITCVPMHPKLKNRRGYNQSELLAKECAKLMGVKYIDALEKFKQNKPQHSLKGSERRKNVKGVYRAINKDKIKGKKILLIDDIITTGNTLSECAKMLKKSGCEEIDCAAVCYVN